MTVAESGTLPGEAAHLVGHTVARIATRSVARDPGPPIGAATGRGQHRAPAGWSGGGAVRARGPGWGQANTLSRAALNVALGRIASLSFPVSGR